MRAWDIDEIKAAIDLFENPNAIVHPVSRGRAEAIAVNLLRKELNYMETGERIDSTLSGDDFQPFPPRDVLEKAHNEGFNEGYKAGVDIIVSLFEKFYGLERKTIEAGEAE